jgi:hypothetical protein
MEGHDKQESASPEVRHLLLNSEQCWKFRPSLLLEEHHSTASDVQ